MWQTFKQTILSKVLFLKRASFAQPTLVGTWCMFKASGRIFKTSTCFDAFWESLSPTASSPYTNLWENVVYSLPQEAQKHLQAFFQSIEPARPTLPQRVKLTVREKEISLFFWYLQDIHRWILWMPPHPELIRPTQPEEEKTFPSELFQKYEKVSEVLKDFPLLLWHRNAKQQVDFCNLLYAQLQENSLEAVLWNQDTFFPSSKIASLFQKVQQTGKVEHVTFSKRIHQKRHFFEIWEKPDPQTRGTWGIGFDISDHENQQEGLRVQLAILKKTAEHLPQGIAFFEKTQRLLYANRAFQDLFRLNPDWLSKQPSFEDLFDELRNQRLLPEVLDFSVYKKRFLNFFQEYYPKEEMLHLPDERSLKMTILPHQKGGVVFIFENMTEQWVLERKHNALMAGQTILARHLDEGILILSVDQRILLMNDRCQKFWDESTPSSWENQYIAEFFNQQQKFFQTREAFEHLKKTICTAMLQRNFQEGICQQKEGRRLRFKYIPLPNGEHLITYQDISDQLSLTGTLDEAKKLLNASWLLEQKTLLSTPITEEKQVIDLVHMFARLQKFFQLLIQRKKLVLHIPTSPLDPLETKLSRENFFRFLYYLLGYTLQSCQKESQIFFNFQARSLRLRLRISYTRASHETTLPASFILLKFFAENCQASLQMYGKKTNKQTIICDF
ncbi:MAG: PAS-domain containing protein [Alphaproteobacteria bacterium]